jgi:hypothetical protein
MNDIVEVLASSKWNIVAFEVFIIAAGTIAWASGDFVLGLFALAVQAGFHTVFALIRSR